MIILKLISRTILLVIFTSLLYLNIASAQTASDYMLRGIEHFYSYDSSFEDAAQDFSNAINLKPDYADAYYWRAFNYWLTLPSTPSEFERVLRDINKAIVLNPSFSSAYVLRGDVRFEQKDFKRAIQDYTKAIELDPNNVDIYFSRGYTKYWYGDKEGAKKDFDKRVEIKKDDTEVLIERAGFSEKIGDMKGAITDYNRAIEIDPNYAVAFAGRGLLKIGLGKKDQGCVDLLSASKLGLGKDKMDVLKNSIIINEYKKKVKICK